MRDVISMRALVVYESMFGNTRLVASNIADGLRAGYEVTVVPVAKATPELVAAADLLVAGVSHAHARAAQPGVPATGGADGGQGRQRAAARPGCFGGPGLRDWLAGIGHRDGLAAAFDTRVNGVAVFTGRASRRIARLLKRHGYRLVAAPQGFLVCSHDTLLDGEASWARRWGMTLGAVSKTYVQNAPAGARS